MNFKIRLFLFLCYSTWFGSSHAQINNCLNFDGTNDYLEMGDVNDLGTSDFTIEAWVFIDEPNPDGSKIINKGLTSAGTPSNAGYSLRANKTAPDNIEFTIGNVDGSIKRLLHSGITTDTWYHVAGVRQGRRLFLYLDGELVQEDSTEVIFNIDTNIPLAMGAISRGELGSPGELLNGQMDEIRIWNIARTQQEIQDNKDCALMGPLESLLAVYNLNSSGGGEAIDDSGFDNNGALIGNPLWVSSTVAPICPISSVETFQDTSIKIFPNPTHSHVFIPSHLKGSSFQIFEFSGKLLQDGLVMSNSITLDHLPSGVYLLKITSETAQHTARVYKM